MGRGDHPTLPASRLTQRGIMSAGDQQSVLSMPPGGIAKPDDRSVMVLARRGTGIVSTAAEDAGVSGNMCDAGRDAGNDTTFKDRAAAGGRDIWFAGTAAVH